MTLKGPVVTEYVSNDAEGLEQSWRFDTRPGGRGDLVIRIRVEGMAYRGSSPWGLHFADFRTGLGFRYGLGTWTDGRGAQTEIVPQAEGSDIVVRVPARVVDDSAYPAVLDPIVGAEFGIDTPVKGPAEDRQSRPAVAPFAANQYFAAWRDRRSGEEMLCGARIASDGTLIDSSNVCFAQWAAKFSVQPKLDDIAVACSATRCAVFAFVMETATSTAVYGMRIDVTGAVPTALDSAPVRIGTGSTLAKRLSAASDGSSFMVPFRSDTTPLGILGVGILPASGAPTYVGPVLAVNQYDDDVTIGFNGTNYVVVTATSEDGKLIASRVSTNGLDLDATDKVLYDSAGYKAWSPSLTPAADRLAFSRAWTDPGAPYRIEAYTINASLDLALAGSKDSIVPIGRAVVSNAVSATCSNYGTAACLLAWEENPGTDSARIHADVCNCSSCTSDKLNPLPYVSRPVLAGPFVLFEHMPLNAPGLMNIRLDRLNDFCCGSPTWGLTWTKQNSFVSAGARSQRSPSIQFDGTRHLVAWDALGTTEPGLHDILGAQVSASGLVSKQCALATTADDDENPLLAFGANNSLLTWTREGERVGSRVTLDCTAQDVTPLSFIPASASPGESVIAYGGGYYLAAWEDNRSATTLWDIWAARLDNNGVLIDTNGFKVAEATGAQRNPKVAFDGAHFLIIWDDDRAGWGIGGASVSPLSPSATATTPLSSIQNTNRAGHALASSGSNFLVTWSGGASANDRNILGTFVTLTGTNPPALAGSSFVITSNVADETAPSVSFDGFNYLVLWEDGDINGRWVGKTSGALGTTTAVSVDPATTERGASAAFDKYGRGLAVYQRYSSVTTDNNPKVFARVVSNGLLLGEASTVGSECVSGYASDGVCCDTACAGECDGCTTAQGAIEDGFCRDKGAAATCGGGAYMCPVSGGSCPASCTGDSACAPDHYCDQSGSCQPRKTKGVACDGSCKEAGCRVCQSALVCTDGVCCGSACAAGGCDVCAASLGATADGDCTILAKGKPGSPECASHLLCGGTEGACPVACDSDSMCADDYYCAADHSCKPQKALGSTCDLAAGQDCLVANCRACDSSFCADGVCCNKACSDECDVCNTNGQCSVKPAGSTGDPKCPNGEFCNGVLSTCPTACVADADCSADRFCGSDGMCHLRLSNGGACDPVAHCKLSGCRECQSNQCADGVCCDKVCAGACEVCSVALGASADGTCTIAPQGFAGDPGCVTMVCNGISPSCPTKCNGDASCLPGYYCSASQLCEERKPQGALCDDSAGKDCFVSGCKSCASGRCADGFCCDAACDASCDVCAKALGSSADGACGPANAGSLGNPACAMSVCDGSTTNCPSSCANDSACAASAFCDGISCIARLQIGSACKRDRQCASEHCVDGYCCNLPCDGQCESCMVQGSEGTCLAVSGKPHGDRPDCTGTDPSCEGACNGGNRQSCEFPASGTPCGAAATCSGDVLTRQAQCDGAGLCAPQGTQSCAPYSCDTSVSACKKTCKSNTDCAASIQCDVATGKCAAGIASCKDDFTVLAPGGSETDCKPYKCASGVCRDSCSTSPDCASGYQCQSGRCVLKQNADGGAAGSPTAPPPAASVEQDSGCGCTVPGHTGAPQAPLAALIASLALVVRRKRA